MPVLRGMVHAVKSTDPRTLAAVAITHDTWNASLSQIGFVVVRARVSGIEAPYATEVALGGFAVAARIVSLVGPGEEDTAVGPALRMLPQPELEAIEERICEFLQLPELLTGGRVARPVASATPYPLWSNVYRGRKQGDPAFDDRKRYVVASPDPWNAASGYATVVRTTTRFKRNDIEFPLIQRGAARACCGDTTTYPHAALRLAPRDRPQSHVTSAADMRAIARGLVSAYDLDRALERLGVQLAP